MQWHEIRGVRRPPSGAPWDFGPQEGHLPLGDAAVLVGILRRHTTTPNRCIFAVWDGFGALEPDVHWPGAARLHLPNRDYVLLAGPIEAGAASFEPPPFEQSANLWWPEDRAWCVATEIDYAWTYVAGTEGCVQDIVAHPDLEAITTRPDRPAARSVDRRDFNS
jgi:hypothetical protein